MSEDKIKKPVSGGKVAKVPVVMQMEALECGAACLCMIMAYYGRWVPLEQVRKDCGVSRDGSKAGNILKAARTYGFKANGWKMDPELLKKKGKFPCIIHWEFNHFVVCKGINGNKVYLNDPGRGDYVITMEQLDKSFTGICLTFEPTENFVPGGKPVSMAEYAFARLKQARSAALFVMAATVIVALTSLFNTGFSRIFMDKLLTGSEPQWFAPFMIGLGALALIQIIAAWINAIYSIKLYGKMAVIGNSTYMWRVLRLPMEFFSQRYAGDIQQRKSANAELSQTVVDTIAPMAINTVMAIVYLIIMLRYSWALSLLGLLAAAFQLISANIISKRRINITRVLMRDEGKLASATINGVEMIETIKASGAENSYFRKWSGYQASVNSQNVKFQKIDQYLGMLPSVISSLINTLILTIGVWMIMDGELTSGMFLAFQGFLAAFSTPVTSLISSGQQIQELRSSMERIEDVLKYPLDPILDPGTGTDPGTVRDSEKAQGLGEEQSVLEDEEDVSYSKLSGRLEMKNVTFGYSRLEPPLIEDFSLTLEPGKRVAFVGTSGCGKSTLAKLISGLYEPWSGEILFDGKKLKDINRSVFTGSVAVVDQDIILFEDTIANNIKMWDDSIEDFEMIMAARDAHIHDDIMNRDGGYQYRLSEGGTNFSGGQRQRLEIARVLAQDPTMIIMDEATSALDARTEYEVVKSICDRGISCIVIAHRLSTIRDCDEIIVMDHGKVVERGNHDKLMEIGGIYKSLVASE